MQKIQKLFLDDHFILLLIIANTTLICIEGFGLKSYTLDIFESTFSIAFIVEIAIKVKNYGLKPYLSNSWNRSDFLLAMISIPSLGVLFFPSENLENLNVLLALRAFRAFKAFRLLKFLPEADKFIDSITRAVRASYIVLLGFFILIFIISLITTMLYKDIAPEYFNNPALSFYTIFQLFSVEGWYEIPNSIANRSSESVAFFTKLYFSSLLLVGGILGLSLVNSIFVDAMVSDNNEDLENEIAQLKHTIGALHEKIDTLIDTQKKNI